jgi:phosphoribosylformylglycinamidine cyclo-ligase
MQGKGSSAYAAAGVNTVAGQTFVERIKPLVESTYTDASVDLLGGFGGQFEVNAVKLAGGNDGVGTKSHLQWALGYGWEYLGIDLLAMTADDVTICGARPVAMLDQITCDKLDIEIGEQIIKGVAKGCRQAGCALIGGETAEHPDVYKRAGWYDLEGTCIGEVLEESPFVAIKPDDIVFGLESSGVHANGLSLIRNVFGRYLGEGNFANETSDDVFRNNLQSFSNAKIGVVSLGDWLMTPTRIYTKSILRAFELGGIGGFAHITGGGVFENVPRILPDNLMVRLTNGYTPQLPPATREMFKLISQIGNVSEWDMYNTFNMGIGMVGICPLENYAQVSGVLRESGETVHELGYVEERDGEDQVVLTSDDLTPLSRVFNL